MKKSLIFLACAFGLSAYETEGNVLKLGQSDFDNALQEHPNMLVKFFAPWCGHCKTLAPTYLEAASALNQIGSPVKLAEVDCTVHRPLCQKYEVRGYPTVHYFSPGNQKPTKYSSARTKQAIVNWVNEQVPPPKQEVKVDFEKQGNLYKLSSETFEAAQSKFDFLFVKFYAPWCGHCKNMAPAWLEFANSITQQNVAIAEVDCTVHSKICGSHSIRGYPTLKLFVRDNETVEFNKSRTLEGFRDFLNEQRQKLIPGAIPSQKVQEKKEQEL